MAGHCDATALGKGACDNAEPSYSRSTVVCKYSTRCLSTEHASFLTVDPYSRRIRNGVRRAHVIERDVIVYPVVIGGHAYIGVHPQRERFSLILHAIQHSTPSHERVDPSQCTIRVYNVAWQQHAS